MLKTESAEQATSFQAGAMAVLKWIVMLLIGVFYGLRSFGRKLSA